MTAPDPAVDPKPLTEPVCVRVARRLLDSGTPYTRHERERLALAHLPDILATLDAAWAEATPSDPAAPGWETYTAEDGQPAIRRPAARDGLDVARVKQAITNLAVRHGLVKDPPTPSGSLARIYGYSTTPADMDAQIAAEYDRLSRAALHSEETAPTPKDKPFRTVITSSEWIERDEIDP